MNCQRDQALRKGRFNEDARRRILETHETYFKGIPKIVGEVGTSTARPVGMDEALAENLAWSFSGYDMATEGNRGVRRGLDCRDEIG